MSEESQLRERICMFAKSLYARGLTHGSTGNISARLNDGRLLATPTGSSFGFVDPNDLALIDTDGKHVGGHKPTKEMPLHTAFYGPSRSQTGAVVHLHSHHAVALSVMPDLDPDNMLPPITPYGLMQLGKVKLLPYFRPGDPAMGEAVRDLAPTCSALVLANHGPVVAMDHLDKAVYAMEELEATARLVLETHGRDPSLLSRVQIDELARAFDIEV